MCWLANNGGLSAAISYGPLGVICSRKYNSACVVMEIEILRDEKKKTVGHVQPKQTSESYSGSRASAYHAQGVTARQDQAGCTTDLARQLAD